MKLFDAPGLDDKLDSAQKSAKWNLELKYGFCYTTSMLATNTALKYVSYPTQALAKSCKPLPVFLSGFFIPRKKYHLLEYISLLFIVAGIFMYNFFKSKSGGTTSLFGLTLLAGSLMLDGFSGFASDSIRHKFPTTSWSLMYRNSQIATVSLFVLTVGGYVTGYHEKDVVTYFQDNPDIFGYIVQYSILSSIGQVFIFKAVKEFGPLSLSIMTTIRKFATYFASVIFFGHLITAQEYACVVLIIIGVGIDFYCRYFVKSKVDSSSDGSDKDEKSKKQ